jgi:hypothetical protein
MRRHLDAMAAQMNFDITVAYVNAEELADLSTPEELWSRCAESTRDLWRERAQRALSVFETSEFLETVAKRLNGLWFISEDMTEDEYWEGFSVDWRAEELKTAAEFLKLFGLNMPLEEK